MNGTTLSIRNDVYDLEHIRKAFHAYMVLANPKLKPRTLNTYCSDAFFIFEQLPESWVRHLVADTTTPDADLQKRLQDIILNDITSARTCPEKDAKAYTRHFWHLLEFLRILYTVEEGRIAIPRRIGA